MFCQTKTPAYLDGPAHSPRIHHVQRVKEVRADRSACNPVGSSSLCRIMALDVVRPQQIRLVPSCDGMVGEPPEAMSARPSVRILSARRVNLARGFLFVFLGHSTGSSPLRDSTWTLCKPHALVPGGRAQQTKLRVMGTQTASGRPSSDCTPTGRCARLPLSIPSSAPMASLSPHYTPLPGPALAVVA